MVGGGQIGKISCTHTHTHGHTKSNAHFHPTAKLANRHINSALPHTYTHTTAFQKDDRFDNGWNEEVHHRTQSSFLQLWLKTPQRSESYWSLDMNNQPGTRAESHTEATHTHHTHHTHHNRSCFPSNSTAGANLSFLLPENEIVPYSTSKFLPSNAVELQMKRKPPSLSKPGLTLKSYLFHGKFAKSEWKNTHWISQLIVHFFL